MKKTWQIIFSGIGGQGLIVAGNLLGEAATVRKGLNATMTSAFGVETRGTFTKSDLIISSEPIDYPEAVEPDVVLCLAQVAYDRYVSSVDANTIIVFDSDSIQQKSSQAKQYGIGFASQAKELGNQACVNVLALGFLVGLTNAVEAEAVEKTIEAHFATRAKLGPLNKAAFQLGVEQAKHS